jgi:YaiO family outer membrane protein
MLALQVAPLRLASAAETKPRASAQQLYDAGVRARMERRFEQAASELRRAANLEPKNADIRLQLGLALAALERFDEARQELSLALTLAPDYVDVEIGLARLDLWQGRLTDARNRAERLLHANPDQRDVQELSQSIAALERQQTKQQSDAPRLRVSRFDGSVSYAELSGGRAPWREISLAASFAASDGTILTAVLERATRFDRHDTLFGGRVDTLLAPEFGVSAGLGGTPGADFKPQAVVSAGAWWRKPIRTDAFDAARFGVDARHAAFTTGDVTTVILSLEIEAFDDDASLTGRHINVIDETGAYQSGYGLQLRFEATPVLAILCGWSQAPDTSEGRTFETRTMFAGVQATLFDPVVATATYAHDELEGLYRRSTGTVALSYRFEPS